MIASGEPREARRRRGREVVATSLLVAVLVLGLRAGPATSAIAPARLLVAADEFKLTLSRPSIRRGEAIVQLLNRGEDDHDLGLQRVPTSGRAAGRTVRLALTSPGALSQRTLRLSPGRYRLWCSLPGHRELGMRATLRVRSGRSAREGER